LASAPRDTRLRRAGIDLMQRGESLRGGGYFLLRRGLPRFGSQPYCLEQLKLPNSHLSESRYRCQHWYRFTKPV
jgi:hypothetical protein